MRQKFIAFTAAKSLYFFLTIFSPTAVIAADCSLNYQSMGASIISENNFECEIEKEETFQSFKVISGVTDASPTKNFLLNDRIVICITLPFSGYVTVWDAAPNGERELIYPNSISHPDGNTSVGLEVNEKECIGEVGSGYEIIVPASEGMGKGQFYLLVTKTEEMQLSANDFLVPAYGMSVSINSEKTEIESMDGYYDTWIQYNVSE